MTNTLTTNRSRSVALASAMAALAFSGLGGGAAGKPLTFRVRRGNRYGAARTPAIVPAAVVRPRVRGRIYDDAEALRDANRAENSHRPAYRKLTVNLKKIRRQLRYAAVAN